jgi:hypothetical protein
MGLANTADGGKEEPVTRKMFDVLWSHRKDFTGGSFINSQSELYFAGGVDGVNALLADLAKVQGATLRVRLSKDAGVTRYSRAGSSSLIPARRMPLTRRRLIGRASAVGQFRSARR